MLVGSRPISKFRDGPATVWRVVTVGRLRGRRFDESVDVRFSGRWSGCRADTCPTGTPPPQSDGFGLGQPARVTVLAIAFGLGISCEIFGIGWKTALGQHVPIDKLSRVSSYNMLGSLIASPAGQLSVGYVAAAISVKAVELDSAAIYVLLTAAVAYGGGILLAAKRTRGQQNQMERDGTPDQ